MVILSINGKWTNKSIITVLFTGMDQAEFIELRMFQSKFGYLSRGLLRVS